MSKIAVADLKKISVNERLSEVEVVNIVGGGSTIEWSFTIKGTHEIGKKQENCNMLRIDLLDVKHTHQIPVCLSESETITISGGSSDNPNLPAPPPFGGTTLMVFVGIKF